MHGEQVFLIQTAFHNLVPFENISHNTIDNDVM